MTALDEQEGERLLLQLQDGELSADDATRAEDHLLQDVRFAGRVKQQRALRQRLAALRNPEVPAGFGARLQARLANVQPSPWTALAHWFNSWRIPLVLGGALATGTVLLLWNPAQSGQGQGVGASAMMAAPVTSVDVSLRLRTAPAQWDAVAQALNRAGVTVSGQPLARGGVHVWEASGTGASTRAAAEALSALVPVEVVGGLPAADSPVRVKIVLVTP